MGGRVKGGSEVFGDVRCETEEFDGCCDDGGEKVCGVERGGGGHLPGMADEAGFGVYYWRETAKNKGDKDNEVDFILVNDGEVIAIEVKSGRRTMNSGLPAFANTFHPKKSFVVGSGGVSLEDFLSADIKVLFD